MIASQIGQWRTAFATYGFRGPLWVTEAGYPSDPRNQYDPGFRQGERSQAGFLARALPAMLEAGAERVYVTERDDLSGAFASGGLLGGRVADGDAVWDASAISPKPAFRTLQGLTQRSSSGVANYVRGRFRSSGRRRP